MRAALPRHRGASIYLITAALLLGVACSSDTATTKVVAPSYSSETVQGTWLWEAAFDEGLDMPVLTAVAQRWLSSHENSSDAWSPPGTAAKVEGAVGAQISARIFKEDARALEQLGSLHAHALCRLSQAPNSFGGSVPEGYIYGAAACRMIGDEDAARRCEKNLASVQADGATTTPPSKPPPSSAADWLAPTVDREVLILGESLRYRLLDPSHFQAAADRLRVRAKALGSEASTDTLAATRFFITSGGTSRWSDSPTPKMKGGLDLLRAVPAGSGQSAAVEDAVESQIVRWRRSLAEQTIPGGEAIDSSTVALLNGWFRKALYRDIGLQALADGAPGLALMSLEEAAGARSRLRPGPGQDPLLLAGIARSRYEENELHRAVDLLNDMATAPGWESAAMVAQVVARVAVLPSTAEAKVNR